MTLIPKERPGLLLVLHPGFFCARSKHGLVLAEWSDIMLREASLFWEHTLVLEDWRGVTSSKPKLKLGSRLFVIGLHNVEAVDLDGKLREAQVEIAKRRIIAHGGEIRSSKNPHDVAIFNIDQYIEAPHFTCAGFDDHQKAGIRLDKPFNFNEVAKNREARTIW